jgi:hypothetical protein
MRCAAGDFYSRQAQSSPGPGCTPAPRHDCARRTCMLLPILGDGAWSESAGTDEVSPSGQPCVASQVNSRCLSSVRMHAGAASRIVPTTIPRSVQSAIWHTRLAWARSSVEQNAMCTLACAARYIQPSVCSAGPGASEMRKFSTSMRRTKLISAGTQRVHIGAENGQPWPVPLNARRPTNSGPRR